MSFDKKKKEKKNYMIQCITAFPHFHYFNLITFPNYVVFWCFEKVNTNYIP